MPITEPMSPPPLRLWPGVAAAVLLVLAGYVIPIFEPRYAGLAMLWALGGALIVILWWLLFSRARWYERLGAIVLMIAVMIPEKSVVHPSIAGAAMGYLSYILTIPTLSLALVAWAAVSRRLAPGARAARRSQPSCSDACRGWWSGPVASTPTDGRISTGAGRRRPRSGCSLWPPTNPRPALRLRSQRSCRRNRSRRHPTRPSTRLGAGSARMAPAPRPASAGEAVRNGLASAGRRATA